MYFLKLFVRILYITRKLFNYTHEGDTITSYKTKIVCGFSDCISGVEIKAYVGLQGATFIVVAMIARATQIKIEHLAAPAVPKINC